MGRQTRPWLPLLTGATLLFEAERLSSAPLPPPPRDAGALSDDPQPPRVGPWQRHCCAAAEDGPERHRERLGDPEPVPSLQVADQGDSAGDRLR